MWTIDKPSLRKACGKDLDELVNHCNNLDDTIKPVLKQLYKEYDAQGGSVTPAQIAVVPKGKESVIHSQYNKTREGNTLSFIRSDLMNDVFKCPYCSINQPDTLDHYMPESLYEALAVCRLNLVPMCGRCNNLKSVKPFNNFIHCYYQQYPIVEPFLKARVFVLKNRFVVRMYVDDAVLSDPILINKVHYQLQELKIFSHVMKESSVFISTLCRSCDCTNNADLMIWLNKELATSVSLYGFNDWRSAIIRGMLAYEKLDVVVFHYNKTNPRL